MTAPDARPERVWVVPSSMPDLNPFEMLSSDIRGGVPYVPESRLREVEAERDKWHNLVKSLCDEWNDECPPGCDSYAHEDDCGATSITVAMRKRGEEIATLRAERDALVPLLQYFVEYVEDGVDEDEAPKHDCAFRSNPEAGYCEFHEQWAAARAILDRLGKEAK